MMEFKKVSYEDRFVKNALYFTIHGTEYCELYRFFSFSVLSKSLERECDSCIHSTGIIDDQKLVVTFFDQNGNECEQYLEFEKSEKEHMRNELHTISESYLDPNLKFNVVGIEVSPYIIETALYFVIQMNDKLVTTFVKKYRGRLEKTDIMENIKNMQSDDFYKRFDLSKIKIDGIDVKSGGGSCRIL
jgi:hypothetical protein